MSGTVTGLDLDRLEELAEKATGAPWEAKVYRFPNMAGPKWPEVSGGRVLRDGGTMLVTDQVHYADDAEFIAEFRNAVPSLLAAARAVQRVRALHVPYDCTAAGEKGHETCGEREWCYSCPEELGWPCPTVIALDGE